MRRARCAVTTHKVRSRHTHTYTSFVLIRFALVVWATTNAVGCGVTFCNPLTGSTGSTVAQFSILVVCNYKYDGSLSHLLHG